MSGSQLVHERPNRLYSLSLTRPVRVMLALFLVAVLIKILDTFILRLDEALGEAILTKGLGFLVVVAYLWACGRSLGDIGLRRQGAGPSLLIGGVCVTALFVLSYGVQLIALAAGGEDPALVLTAVDPKSGMEGGFLFGLWLILGNLVNSAMEEGLFRGLMLPHFRIRYSPWRAVLLQAVLFAIWHLNWPVKNLMWNDATVGEAAFEALSLLLATFISGLLLGYLYHKTNNLWGPYLAHTINNTVLNVLFIRAAGETLPSTNYGLFLALWLPGSLLLILVFRWWANRLRLPEVMPWGTPERA